MWDRIKNFLLPPVFEGDEEKTNRARLLNSLLIIIILTATLFPVVSLLAGASIDPIVSILVMTLIGISIGLAIFMRMGYVQLSGIILSFVWWAIFTFGIYYFGGIHDTAITGFFFLIILSSVIGGWRILLSFSSLAALSIVGVYLAEQNGVIQPSINTPPDAADLAMPIVIIMASTFVLRIALGFLNNAYDNAKGNAEQLEKINTELQESRDILSQRTIELEQRTSYLEATSVVARDVASELDPETLIQRIVILVTEQFDFYHTGLFLIDDTSEFAVLRAASSKGGRQMLERGHRLRVGEEGIVGFVSGQGRSRVALDTGSDAVYFDNPDLPNTRSEAALPLRVRGQIIGVLDVQSTKPQAFNDNDIAVLQTLADQIAVALHTARLFQQVDENLKTQQQAYGEVAQEAWKNITDGKDLGYQYIRGEVVPTGEQPNIDQPELPEISLPIEIGTQTVGYITAHKPSPDLGWNKSEIAIMETLSEQLGVALESARLYQDTQARAAREQLTGEVTTRIRETMDIETIIKTASEEIRKALNLPEVVIRLGEPSTDSNKGMKE